MRKIARLSLVAGAAAAVIGGAVVAGPSFATPGGGECELSGVANFHPGPGTDQNGTINYDFSGNLTNCGDSTTGPAGFGTVTGTITAGQTYVDPNGGTHAEPAATGTGSCASGTTSGVSFVKWSDQTESVISYTTTSAAAGVVLQGTVLPSYTLPDGTKVVSTKYAGDGAAGLLAFEVADPTACANGGVTSANIDGFTGLGSSS